MILNGGNKLADLINLSFIGLKIVSFEKITKFMDFIKI